MTAKQKLPMGRDIILAGAQAVFFKALLAGYAGGGDHEVTVVSHKTDWTRRNTARVGDYEVIDEWDVNPYTDCSGGRTRILFHGVPVWMMFYVGSYTDEAIPLLMEALAHCYQAAIFNGGRGPDCLEGGGLVYLNHVSCGGFTYFRGREEILRHNVSGESLGFHDYMGKALI
jgi:hypothetical protein